MKSNDDNILQIQYGTLREGASLEMKQKDIKER